MCVCVCVCVNNDQEKTISEKKNNSLQNFGTTECSFAEK